MNVKLSIDEALDIYQVHEPGTWENDASSILNNWWAVSNEDGIIAYFSTESQAYRHRLSLVNILLNG